MLMLPYMLTSAAEQVGIPVPEGDLDNPDTYRNSHPQFFVLCMTQLCRPMVPGEHFENAKALAAIPIEEMKAMTASELQARGCNCGI